MICEYCGNQIPDGSMICSFCDADVSKAHATGARPVQQPAPNDQVAQQQAFPTAPTDQQQAPRDFQAAPRQGSPDAQPSPQPQTTTPPADPAAPSPKRSIKMPLVIAAAAVLVVAVLVGMFAFGGGGDKKLGANMPDAARSAIQDGASLADELAKRYEGYTPGESQQSNIEGRTYEVASAEIQTGLDRVRGDISALEAAGGQWNGYDQALSAMRNVEGALKYEKDVLEAQHTATMAGVANGGTAAQALETLYDGYTKIEPPDCLRTYVESTLNKLPTIYTAWTSSAKSAPSALTQMTSNELASWWLAKQGGYDTEGIRILVKQCVGSRDMLEGLANGTAVADKPSAQIETIDKIAPNLYPSLDAAAIVGVTAYGSNQSVTVSAEVVGFTQKFEQKFQLAQGYNHLPVKPSLLPSQNMTNLSSNSTTQLEVKVVDDASGNVVAQVSQPVDLLSMYDFAWYDDEFGSTAAFDILAWLRPQSDNVLAINRRAADFLGSWTNGKQKTISGYQYGTDVIATLLQVAAIQSAISDAGVVYIMDSYSYKADQHVLTPDKVVEKKQGLCIETSLLMASCLMSANMHPLIILTPGHAQIAVETYRGSGNYFLIETTKLPYAGVDTSLSSTQGGFYQGLLASAKTDDGSTIYWTLNGTSEEWERYLNYKADGSDEFGGVFVIDCDLQRLLEIQGIENM